MMRHAAVIGVLMMWAVIVSLGFYNGACSSCTQCNERNEWHNTSVDP